MSELVGLIPAAGKGVRARPYTSLVPKGMLPIDGRPNLERIITLMREDLGIRDIFMTVGYLSQVIKDYFGDGSRFGVRLHYVDNDQLDKGLAWSVLLAGRQAAAPCCVMLSDECYIDTNHHELKNWDKEALVTCAVMQAEDAKLIRRNYSVKKEGNRILRLLEKPQVLENNLLGLGTFILNREFFPLLEEEIARAADGYVEFVTFIDSLCDQEPGVRCFQMTGNYVNINDRDSLNLARYYERNRTFGDNKIALLLIAEGSEEGIDFTIRRYQKNPLVHSLHVVLPAEASNLELVRQTGAEPLICPPGMELFGEKLRYGLKRVSADILILAEGDYTFAQHDINKLLEYLKEADMVIGTRTTRQLIEQGSDMRGLVRLANIFLAKLLELLWWRREVRISDVSCTFRAIWRSSYSQISEQLNSRGPEVLAELVVETLNERMRIIEIPVNYYNRSEALYQKYRNRATFFRITRMLGAKMWPRIKAKLPVLQQS